MNTDLRGSSILLVSRVDATRHLVAAALCTSMSMHPDHVGPKGDPAIECISINMDALRHSGTSDWTNSLTRTGDVVHASHPDWIDGRVSRCYELVDAGQTIENVDWAQIAARVAHEANRIFCAMHGDTSHLPWMSSPNTVRDSLLLGVGLVADMHDIMPWDQHNAWMKSRLDAGWKYGPVRDADAKTHPALLPYNELPNHQRAKDWMFISVARAVFGFAPFELSTSIPRLDASIGADLFPVKRQDMIDLANVVGPDVPTSTPDMVLSNAAQTIRTLRAELAEAKGEASQTVAAAVTPGATTTQAHMETIDRQNTENAAMASGEIGVGENSDEADAQGKGDSSVNGIADHKLSETELAKAILPVPDADSHTNGTPGGTPSAEQKTEAAANAAYDLAIRAGASPEEADQAYKDAGGSRDQPGSVGYVDLSKHPEGLDTGGGQDAVAEKTEEMATV